jgi:hypothetical protein
MVARGEREARSPWNVREKKDRPGRPTETGQRVCRPSGARALFICDPGASAKRVAWNVREEKYRPGRPTETGQRICRPSGARALFICDPGAACSLRSHLPLATICRACGASDPWLPFAAPAALRPRLPIYRACGASEPGYHLPRLRRFGTLRAPPARTNNDVNFSDRTQVALLIHT